MKALYPTLLTAALASFALVGCNRGGDNLAIVNGEPITMEDFHRYLERKQTVQVVFPQSAQVQPGQAADLPVAQSLGFQALRDLVNRRILLQVAKDKGVFPADGDVSAELEFQKKLRPDYVPFLVNQGLTIDEIRRELTVDLSRERIVTKGITIPSKEVDDYIKDPAHAAEFTIPAQAKISFILLDNDTNKKAVDSALTSGTPFGNVAKMYSNFANAREGGAYQNTNVAQMPPVFQSVIAKTKERSVSDWTNVEGKLLKVYVEQKVDAKKRDITDVIREVVRRKLAMDQGSQATDLGTQLVNKLMTAKIDILQANLKDPWKKTMDALKEANAAEKQAGVQSNTRTGGTGTAPSPAGAPAPTGAAPQ